MKNYEARFYATLAIDQLKTFIDHVSGHNENHEYVPNDENDFAWCVVKMAYEDDG